MGNQENLREIAEHLREIWKMSKTSGKSQGIFLAMSVFSAEHYIILYSAQWIFPCSHLSKYKEKKYKKQ